MKMTKILSAAAMLSLVTAPIAAQAATPVRASSTQKGEDIAGVSTLVLLLIAAAAVAIVVVVADGKDKPVSP